MVLAQALQQCTIQSAMPPGMLYGAVQEFHRCLAPLLKKGEMLDLTMLDVAEKDPVTLSVPTERTLSLEKKSEPREEEPINLPASNGLQASEPEEAAPSGELALMWRRLPLAPPGFTGSWQMRLAHPLEEADLPVNIPLGA